MRQLNTLLPLLTLLSFVTLVNAQSTFYANSTTGNDSNPGTSGLPFQTFHKAYTTASAGDIIDLTGTFDWTDAGETGDVSTTGYTLDKDITIQGQGRGNTYIQAASAYNTADRRVFYMSGSTTDVVIKDLTIRYGKTSTTTTLQFGGGIHASNINSLSLESCNIEYNYVYASSTAAYGGGMYLVGSSGKTYNIDKCNVNNNTVETDHGAATSSSGGGLYLSGSCTVNIDYSSIYANHSDNSTASHGLVGAIYFGVNTGTLTNCTIANNTQTGEIGSIRTQNVSSFTMTNCTVVGNQTCTGYGSSSANLNGGFWCLNTTVYLKNNIFANNTYNGINRDVSMYSGNTVNDNGYNVVEFSNYTFSGTGNITGDQANLFGTGISTAPALADNGTTFGTKTAAVSTGSVTIGAGGSGTNGAVSVPTMDQRGGTRVTMDIGSYGFDATMPVELIHFSAKERAHNTVLLNWATASELNNSHFEIEHSVDGKDWKSIGDVRGNGTTFEKVNYSFEDRNPTKMNYYRLKQVDFDGAFEYSQVRAVELGNVADIEVFPNPASNFVNVHSQGATNIELIEILDVSGRLLLHQEGFGSESEFIQVDISKLGRGIYFMNIQNGKHSKIRKIVKE